VGALPQMVYRHKNSVTNELKRVVIDCWAQVSQDALNQATDQLPKRLTMVIKVNGAPVELRLD